MTVINMNGQNHKQEIVLKDYQEFQGIKFPTIRIGKLGTEALESKLLEASNNVDLTEADLE